MEKPYTIDDLKAVMARLRDPDTGCPWDVQQDFQSIAPFTIEEAYEVADAIGRNDMKDLREELGDLLLQSVYHAQMAQEIDAFTLDDVVNDVTDKMITRHPHVFGDQNAENSQDVDAIWEAQKDKEKPKESVLDGVTRGLPALLRAQKLQKRAAKIGFEWEKAEHVLDKLDEELEEMKEAVAADDKDSMLDELGDLLFVLVNYGRMLGLDCETALRHANNKFEHRFRGMEEDLKVKYQDLSTLSLDQMEEEWQAQKRKEKAG